MRVGGPYPVIQHRQFPDRFEVGDVADMARIRRHHENAPRTAWRWAAIAAAIGAALALAAAVVQ